MQDLHNARWAQVRRNEYINAGDFLVAHNIFYSDVVVDREAAANMFSGKVKCGTLGCRETFGLFGSSVVIPEGFYIQSDLKVGDKCS